jgi:hypothetical protein
MGWASRHQLLARAVNRHLGGVPVTWGAVSAEAIFEKNSEIVLSGNSIVVEYVLHNLPSSLFGEIKYDDIVTVDGETFKVLEPMVIGDGAYMMLSLSKPEGVIIGDFITTLDNLKLVTQDGRYLVTL